MENASEEACAKNLLKCATNTNGIIYCYYINLKNI